MGDIEAEIRRDVSEEAERIIAYWIAGELTYSVDSFLCLLEAERARSRELATRLEEERRVADGLAEAVRDLLAPAGGRMAEFGTDPYGSRIRAANAALTAYTTTRKEQSRG